MTLDEIASYCEFQDCQVSFGDPDAGFLHVDGAGLQNQSYTYGRFHMLNEISSLASPREVLAKASVFKVRRGDSTMELTREDFETELRRFQELVG